MPRTLTFVTRRVTIQSPVVDDDSVQLDAVMSALADPTRRRLFRLLRATPALSTGELATRNQQMTRWGVMKHLAALREAGLVQSLDDGRHRRHYADTASIEILRQWLDEDP